MIKWADDGSNAHIVTHLRVQLRFDSYKHVTFKGVVDTNYLKGTKLSGTATIPDTLKPVGVGGGNCQNKKRVKNLAYTNDRRHHAVTRVAARSSMETPASGRGSSASTAGRSRRRAHV